MLGRVILIGGAPTVGKTTLAQNLSQKLNIPWISTDTLRSIMRSSSKKEYLPYLFDTEGETAETYYTKYSPEQVMERQIKEGEEIWPGVMSLIYEQGQWESFIVEGIAIMPHLIDRDLKKNTRKRPFFILDENENRINKVLHTRGLWGDADTYPHDLKPLELEWVRRHNRWYKLEAEKYGFPTIEAGVGDIAVDSILNLIN